MNLKETIWKISQGVNSELSTETLASLTLFNISKNEYFKDNYNHLQLIKNKEGEIRIFSAYLNNADGLSNSNSSTTVINPNYQDIEDSFFKNDDNDDTYYSEDSINYTDTVIFIPDNKFENINTFFHILENSNSFNEVVEKLEQSDPLVLLDVSQNIISNNSNKSRDSIKPFFDIINNLYIHNNSDGFYQLENNRIEFGSTNCRDYFNCNALETLARANNEKNIAYSLNRNSKWAIESLFIDKKTNKIPEEVILILEDPEIDNWEATRLYNKPTTNYNNELLKIAISHKTKEEKHFDIANHFFNKIKEKTLGSKENCLNSLRPISELNFPSKLIEAISERVSNYYPSLKNSYSENVTIKHYNPIENSWSEGEQFIDLCNASKLAFYKNDYINNATRGFKYIQNNSFAYAKQKENFTISISSEDDLIGYGHFFIEDGVIRINTVNIATQHRGKKEIKKVYERLIDYAKEKNLPIETSMYSPLAENILPKIKRTLLEENKDILWLDSCFNPLQTKSESLMYDCTERFLKTVNDKFDDIPMALVRKVYDNEKKLIENLIENDELDWSSEYELKSNLTETLISKIEIELNKSKPKNKNKLKK